MTWSEELYRFHGLDPNLPAPPYKDHASLFTAESWDRLQSAVRKPYKLEHPTNSTWR